MKQGRAATEPARGFQVCQVDRRLEKSGRAWGVKQGARWRFCTDLTIQVTVTSTHTEDGTPVLAGVGVVRCLRRGAIVISA